MWVPDNYHFISQVVLPAKYRYKTYILFFIILKTGDDFVSGAQGAVVPPKRWFSGVLAKDRLAQSSRGPI